MVALQRGFTFVEVMIVLAVSSAMLVMSASLFSGRQREVQFNQSIREIESKIQDVMNDVSTGYFPNSEIRCTPGAGPGARPGFDTVSTKEQGSNPGCIFVGKAIHFTKDRMNVVSLVGNRMNGGVPSASFAASSPAIVSLPSVTLTESFVYPWGVELSDNGSPTGPMLIDSPAPNTPATNNALIIFASSVNGTGNSPDGSGSFNTGTQRIQILSSGTVTGQTVDDISSDMSTDSIDSGLFALPSLAWAPGGSVIFCFQSQPFGESGRITGGIRISGVNGAISAKYEDALCR